MFKNHKICCSLRENIEQTVKNMSADHNHEHNRGIDTIEHLAKHLG